MMLRTLCMICLILHLHSLNSLIPLVCSSWTCLWHFALSIKLLHKRSLWRGCSLAAYYRIVRELASVDLPVVCLFSPLAVMAFTLSLPACQMLYHVVCHSCAVTTRARSRGGRHLSLWAMVIRTQAPLGYSLAHTASGSLSHGFTLHPAMRTLNLTCPLEVSVHPEATRGFRCVSLRLIVLCTYSSGGRHRLHRLLSRACCKALP